MQKAIKNLLKDSFLIIAVGITIGIAYLSLVRVSTQGVGFAGIDKLFHFIAYFTLSFSWLLAFYRKVRLKYVIIILCILYGILIEVLQNKLTDYRTGDYQDIIANTIGIFIALIFFNLIFKKIGIKKP